jgi:hypothetical protein
MTRYALAPDAYFCETESGIIFLSLIRDKYLGIPATESANFHRLLSDSPVHSQATQELARDLVDRGLLTSGDVASAARTAPVDATRPERSLLDVTIPDDVPISAVDTLHFFRAYVAVFCALRFGSLAHTVARARRRSASLSRSESLDLTNAAILVAKFRRLRPLAYSAREKCLLDSFVLAEFLAAYQIFPQCVIGVMTGPFRAHCWAQCDDIVFADSVTRVRMYTPILAT